MNDIRFAHYRVFDIYNNRILSNGGVTLAIGITDSGKYRIAGAKCHEVDHYCKRHGRTKSRGRLFCKHSFVLEEVNKTIVRKINWVELDDKPDLETLLSIAESFYQHYIIGRNQVLVNSGVYFNTIMGHNHGL